MRLLLAGLLLLFSSFPATPPAPFVDVTDQSGIDFVLHNGATGEKHQIETMAGGVAAFDYDGDGRPDLYFTNGAPQPGLRKTAPEWQNRLYRNTGGMRFEDVTARAGVQGSGFEFGVAAADYDGDGKVDLFVAGMPRSHLYRNRGDGSFEDATERAGVTNRQQWPVAAGWFDFDGDGDPDLFVVNYVRWDPGAEPWCGDAARKLRTYCHPKEYSPLPNTLFRNNGDGTFTDVSRESGILAHAGKGMAVAFADYDEDGDLDIYVGNDTTPGFLFRNDGKGRFTEVGTAAGIALTDDGLAVSAMGADFRDMDDDGRPDLFVTALTNETFPFFRNLGRGLFADVTYPSQIGKATLAYSGWSAGMYDFDNDGRKDVFAANGDVNDNTERYSSRTSRQRCLLLLRDADALTFRPTPVGSAALHRGAAFADFDGDGGTDVVVARLNERPAVLRNAMTRGNWIAFRVPLGTVVRVGSQWNAAAQAVGYASSSDPVVHFGLGRSAEAVDIEIRRPGGKVERIERLAGGRVYQR
jgi:hypothetical protein